LNDNKITGISSPFLNSRFTPKGSFYPQAYNSQKHSGITRASEKSFDLMNSKVRKSSYGDIR
jgi:hypothetical protein